MIGFLYLFLLLLPLAAIFAAFAGKKVTYLVLGSISLFAWYIIFVPQ